MADKCDRCRNCKACAERDKASRKRQRRERLNAYANTSAMGVRPLAAAALRIVLRHKDRYDAYVAREDVRDYIFAAKFAMKWTLIFYAVFLFSFCASFAV